jgi:uncharacterized protein YciI
VKYVLFYESADGSESKIPLHFPAHQALWHQFKTAGTLLMIGPFTEQPPRQAMAVFTTRAAAEQFVAVDPFVTNGIVGKWTIHEWNEVLMP